MLPSVEKIGSTRLWPVMPVAFGSID